MPAKMSRAGMIKVMTRIQNRVVNHNRDILTFTGFLNDDELGVQVVREFMKLSQADRDAVFASTAEQVKEAA